MTDSTEEEEWTIAWTRQYLECVATQLLVANQVTLHRSAAPTWKIIAG